MCPDASKERLTGPEVARRLGVHPGTLVNWRVWGKGPKFVREGRNIRYKLEDVRAWEKEKRA